MKNSPLLSKIYACFFVLVLFISVQPASAAIVSDFESGPSLDGWKSRTGAQLTWVFDIFDPTNRALDSLEPQTLPYHNIVGGSPLFIGDLSAYDGGTLSFQVRFGQEIPRELAIAEGLSFIELPYGDNSYVLIGRGNSFFGETTLTTDVGSFVLPGIGNLETPDFQWYTHTIPMTAAAWGIDQTTWSLGLQGVTDLQIDLGVDPDQPDEVFSQLDNVRLNAVPVPAAAWLFSTALIGLVGFSKRRKVA